MKEWDDWDVLQRKVVQDSGSEGSFAQERGSCYSDYGQE